MSNNYFKTPTGKVVTQWPFGCAVYRVLTKVLRPHQRDHPPPRQHLIWRSSRACTGASHLTPGRRSWLGWQAGAVVGGEQLEELPVGVADEQRERRRRSPR